MPRFEDRYGSTRLYVGRLSSRTRTRDLESLFSRYGRVRDVDMKHDFAFVEFSDPRDADDARYNLNGRDFDGSRIIVEFAKGGPRGSGGSREYLGRGPPPGSGRCFNCGIDGHWARDCKAGDWKNKCYRCGDRGHIERNCQNSPRKLSRRGRSYSRSPVRSRHGRSRSRSRSPSRSYSRSRSYRSRSPPARDRSIEADKRSVSPSSRYRSPKPRKSTPPASKPRKRSPTPEESRPQESSPNVHKRDREYSQSPREKSRTSLSSERDSPVARRYRSRSPSDTKGRTRSPSPKAERSPVDEDGDEDNNSRSHSPRGIESP